MANREVPCPRTEPHEPHDSDGTPGNPGSPLGPPVRCPGVPAQEFTTERYPSPDPAAMDTLQKLADDGVIQLRTVWCSEKGVLPATGHFCGTDANHEPDTFAVVLSPPAAERLPRKPVPVTVQVPIREPDRG